MDRDASQALTDGPVMTLAEVALLAGVDRSVVSHWRARFAVRGPFPAAVRRLPSGQEFFSCDDVVTWLDRTRVGLNPAFADHVLAFRTANGRALTDDRLFHGLTALLCVRLRAGALPDDPDDLLDLVDELDPDDTHLYSEADALGDDLPGMAAYAGMLADAALDPTEPFDTLLVGRRTPDRPRGAPSVELTQFVLNLALAVADQAEFDDPVLCIVRPQDVALLHTLPARLDERGPIRVAAALAGSDETRLARRWFAAHRLPVTPLVSTDGSGLPEQAVLLAQLDDGDRLADLRWLNELTLHCSDAMRAVVVGTAGALVNPLRVKTRGRPPATGATLTEAGEERRQALRSGFARAILRLPQGLIDPPAASSALWCLGPAAAHDAVHCDDVPGPLQTSAASVVADMAAALGAAGSGRHTASGRSVRQAELVMTSGALVGVPDKVEHSAAHGVLRHFDDLLARVRLPGGRWSVTARDASGVVPRVALAAAVKANDLVLISGARVDAGDLVGNPDIPVASRPDDVRRRDMLPGLTHATIVRDYGHAQYTRPGDIVFDPRATPAACVDDVGGLVVATPARVIRCVEPDPKAKPPTKRRFVPELLAAELAEAATHNRHWKTWQVTSVPVAAAGQALAAASRIAERRRQLEAELAHIPDLLSTLATALGGDLCSLDLDERKSA